MNNIEMLIIERLLEGNTISDIVYEIFRKHTMAEVYTSGELRFGVDEDGDIVCRGKDFVDCIARPSKEASLDDIHLKFMEYFDHAVYINLFEFDLLVKEIRYRDLDKFKALSRYIWDYLKHKIECRV